MNAREQTIINAANEMKQAWNAWDQSPADDQDSPSLHRQFISARDFLIQIAVGDYDPKDLEALNARAIHQTLRMAFVTIQCEHGHQFDVQVPENNIVPDTICPHCK